LAFFDEKVGDIWGAARRNGLSRMVLIFVVFF